MADTTKKDAAPAKDAKKNAAPAKKDAAPAKDAKKDAAPAKKDAAPAKVAKKDAAPSQDAKDAVPTKGVKRVTPAQLRKAELAKRPKKTAVPAEDGQKDSKKGVPAPETVLKHKKSFQEIQAARVKHAAKMKKTRADKRVLISKRAEQYVKEYRNKERDLVRMKRIARNTGSFYVEPESPVILAVRIRGINGVSPKVKKILRLLRLRQIHNAVFLKVNKPITQMLKMVEPYITYGYPNLKTVREMIYKRGFVKVNEQRLPITDNKLIETQLGDKGILCIEDVIHEIFTVGPNFREVNKFLWPFKLASPLGGYVKKRIHFTEGGDAGNREHHINKLIRRMN